MRLYTQKNIAMLASFLVSVIPIHVSMRFKKVYEKEYPDKEALAKGRLYYRHCSSERQWVKDYIFEREFR